MGKMGHAGCPTCKEPLMATFEKVKKEFYCMRCEVYWEFLQPVGIGDSEAVVARHAELQALFDQGIRTLRVGI